MKMSTGSGTQDLEGGSREGGAERESVGAVQAEALSCGVGCVAIRPTGEAAGGRVPSKSLCGSITVREADSLERRCNVE